MQFKTVLMMFVLLALFATMSMARTLQQSSESENDLDEPRFSLRELLQLAAPEKRALRSYTLSSSVKLSNNRVSRDN